MEQKIRSSESRVRSASPLATNGTQEACLRSALPLCSAKNFAESWRISTTSNSAITVFLDEPSGEAERTFRCCGRSHYEFLRIVWNDDEKFVPLQSQLIDCDWWKGDACYWFCSRWSSLSPVTTVHGSVHRGLLCTKKNIVSLLLSSLGRCNNLRNVKMRYKVSLF